MDQVVLLTRAQVELYCHGLADLVWEPPRANACALSEAHDMVDQFKLARWHAGALGKSSPNEMIIHEIATRLSPKLDAWFDPHAWAQGLSNEDALRAEILDAIDSLKHAALENLNH